MVPGMTERERLAADVRRLAWLADARFGPATRVGATAQSPRAFSPLSIGRRALTAALLFGQRVRSLPTPRGGGAGGPSLGAHPVNVGNGITDAAYRRMSCASNTTNRPSARGRSGHAAARRSWRSAGRRWLRWLSRSPDAEAKKNKNKAQKKANKKAERRCEKQGTPCQEFAARLCARVHPPGALRDACLNRANACCSSIEQCDGGAYFDCLFDHLEDLAPPEN